MMLAAGSCAYATDEVAFIVDKNVYNACKANILRYKADVEAQFPVHLRICSEANFESYSPEQMRTYIQGQYNTNHISGAILAGQIQYQTWEQHNGNSGVNSLYYEDLDGTFTDNDDNGVDDYHTWGSNAGPEIWCSWMRPPSINNIGGLNTFLDKTHNYYTGKVQFNHKALIADSLDYDVNIRGQYDYQYQNLSKLYGNNIDILGEGSAKLDGWGYLQKINENSYEIIDTFTHANSQGFFCDTGSVSYWDMQSWITGGGIMSVFFGCHSGDFKEAPDTNFAQSCVFGSSIGQVACGTSWSFGITEKFRIYDVLDQGGYFGQGWFALQKYINDPAAIRKAYNNQEDVNKYMWGQNMIGNPFLYANYTPPVPEPSSLLALLVPGAGTFFLFRRRR